MFYPVLTQNTLIFQSLGYKNSFEECFSSQSAVKYLILVDKKEENRLYQYFAKLKNQKSNYCICPKVVKSIANKQRRFL